MNRHAEKERWTSIPTFSGFSVGFCINEEEGYLLPTIARKITCRCFDWMLQSSSGRKWRGANKHYYSHVIGGQRLVRIAPPFLPPHHSDPVARDFLSSIPVEALLWGCHLDVQGLLHQQLLSSAMVQHCGLLPVDRMVILPCMFHYSWLLHPPPLADILVFLQSCTHPVSNHTSKRALYGFNILMLTSFEVTTVTTVDSQEPTCCYNSHLLLQ